jgi:hypothetical protein
MLVIADTFFGQGMAPAWTSPGSAGSIIDLPSLSNASAGQESRGNLTFNSAASGTITARYNVVNTAVLPMNRSTGRPPWTTFEMAYIMPAGTTITATLYGLPSCQQTPVMICQIPTVATPTLRCDRCTFPNTTFNYFTSIYFIEVTLTRPSTGFAAPAVCSLRVYN